MITYNINNWRDEEGSELEKARKLIKTKPIKLIKISQLSNISYQTIKNYSYGSLNLDNADWSHVSRLAHVWDMVQISNTITEKEAVKFQGKLNLLFKNIKKDNPTMRAVINRLEKIITSDSSITAELYKADKESQKS